MGANTSEFENEDGSWDYEQLIGGLNAGFGGVDISADDFKRTRPVLEVENSFTLAGRGMIKGGSKEITCLAWLPPGPTVKSFDQTTGLVETPAEQVLATGCCDGLAHYIHAHRGAAAPAAIKPLWQTASRQLCFWHTDRVTGVAFARGLFATSCQDRCLRFYDAATGQVAGCIDGSAAAECLCFSASGEWILGGDGCGKIEAYHVPSHIPWELITLAAAQNGVPFSNPFADAPARVGAIPGLEDMINSAERAERAAAAVEGARDGAAAPPPRRDSFVVEAGQRNDDGNRVGAIVRLGRTARDRMTPAEAYRARHRGDEGREYFLAASEEGRLRQLVFRGDREFTLDNAFDFATACSAYGFHDVAAATRADGSILVAAIGGVMWLTVYVYTARLGEPGTLKSEVAFHAMPPRMLTSAAVFRRGESSFDVAASTGAELIRCLRFVEGDDDPILSWPISVAHHVAVRAVAFSPDGLLAAGGSDGTVRLYAALAARRALISCLLRHVAPTPAVTVPEDRTDDLATACRLLLRLPAVPGVPCVLAFLSDGEVA